LISAILLVADAVKNSCILNVGYSAILLVADAATDSWILKIGYSTILLVFWTKKKMYSFKILLTFCIFYF